MTGRQTILALAAVLAVQTAGADEKARPREGGSAGARSAGERHVSGSGAREGSGSRSSVAPPLTDAQRRHPRAGTGTGRLQGRVHYGSPYYGSPYSNAWYGRSWYGYGGYWGYSPYYYSGYYGYSPYYYDRYRNRSGSLRILVEPSKTRVYVDGYYAGIADDFDGLFQRLHLAPGRHDLSLRLDGYRTHNIKVYVPWDHTIKIHHDMARGAGEDRSEEMYGSPGPDPRYEDRGDYGEYDDEGEDPGASEAAGDRGRLRLLIRPSDASVYVNGTFRGTGRLRSLSLPPGRHRVEVVRPGHRTEEREVEVRPGRTTELEIDLERS